MVTIITQKREQKYSCVETQVTFYVNMIYFAIFVTCKKYETKALGLICFQKDHSFTFLKVNDDNSLEDHKRIMKQWSPW